MGCCNTMKCSSCNHKYCEFCFNDSKYEKRVEENEYTYYATGEDVESIPFPSSDEAWDYANSHEGYDCVVEKRE